MSNALKSANNGQLDEATQVSLKRLEDHLNSKLHGQTEVVRLALSALLSKGHLLLEGPPGVGKTVLAKELASILEESFQRIQMTSDLLPSDIVGFVRPDPKTKEFEFQRGPIFTHVLMADELNRTSPKTQAALLEAMAEGHVTVDGKTYDLAKPFFVVATQNPFESRGVYPLAESQLDRFCLQVNMSHPSEAAEISILKNWQPNRNNGDTSFGDGLKSILDLQEQAESVFVEDSIYEYLQKIVSATRSHPQVLGGISIRGSLQLLAVSKAFALISGRSFVVPEDIHTLAIPCLAHRLHLEDGVWSIEPKKRIVSSILENISPPR